ncbi:MAG TPA: O-antigen ligase family protein [Solirubrobacterales bacterium]|nr:O-antigen ligase family protein [Solirubrobacterales bacterium]
MDDDETRRGRRRRLDAGAPGTLAMLVPGAMTVALAFRSGGYFAGATGLAAAAMALLTAVRFTLARKPLVGVNRFLLLAAGAMAMLAGWTLLSADWSGSSARAVPGFAEAVLYGLALFCFGSFPFNPGRTRTMAWGIAGAIVVVCVAALTARLLPGVIHDPSLDGEGRLGYPLTYWNALGILACVGLVLCFHFAAAPRDPWPARVLAAAAVPLVALTLLYTLSRGAIWSAGVALTLYLLLGRPRGALAAVLATGPPTAILIAVATPTKAVSAGYPDLTVAAGRHVAVALALCVLMAAGLRAVLLRLDRRALELRLPTMPPGPALWAPLAAAALACLALAVGLGAPRAIAGKYDEFTNRADAGPAAGDARLLSVRPEARLAFWDAALATFGEHELEGSGAGTFPLGWERHREDEGHIVDAHSLYLETLSDLGLIGLLALLVAVVGILAAFAWRARGPDRALFAALFAAGLAWALHAGADWDWQMPAVTLWLFALGGTALSRPLQRRRRRRRRRRRQGRMWTRVAGVTGCLVLAILPARLAISQVHLESALAAMQRGDCRGARADARAALAALDRRPTPYQVIGYCDLEQGRYRAAATAMAAARRRDPHSATAAYDLAVARAAAGLDPTAAIRAARRLNPSETRTREAVAALTGGDRRRRRAEGRGAALIPPMVGGP